MRASPTSSRFYRTLVAVVIIVLLLPASLAVVPAMAAAVPLAPSDLTAAAADTGQIILKWIDHSSDESAFLIERATDTYFINFKVSFTVPANLNTFSDNTIAAATTYYYRVFAVNADGASAASNTASATSPAQLAFPVSPGDLAFKLPAVGQVSLTWKDLSSNEDGFRIERADDDIFSKGLASFKVAAGTVSFTDQNLAPLTTYFYRVIAYNSAGDSPPSNTISVKTLDLVPTGPTNLDAASQEAWQVTLRWVDNSANETGFRVERATDSDFSQNVRLFTAEANTVQGEPVVTVTDGQVPAGIYYFRVKAFNASGDSTPSNTAQVTVGDQYEDRLATWEAGTVDMSFPGFGLIGRNVKVDASGTLFDNLGASMNDDLAMNMSDGSGNIVIPRNAKVLNANGNALTVISYDSPAILPQPPDDEVIVTAFDFGPRGGHFDTPITLNLKYVPEDLPERTAVQDLKLVLWDGTAWQELTAQLKADQNELIFQTNQLAEFAIVVGKADLSAKFSISNLYIFPLSALQGEPVYINVKVANTGFGYGEYPVSLKINDVVEETRTIGLEAKGSADVKFTFANKPIGRYRADVNGLRGSFAIKAPLEIITPSPTLPVQTTTPPVTTIAPTSTTVIPTFAPAIRFNNVLIFGIIGGSIAIIVIAVGFFLVKK